MKKMDMRKKLLAALMASVGASGAASVNIDASEVVTMKKTAETQGDPRGQKMATWLKLGSAYDKSGRSNILKTSPKNLDSSLPTYSAVANLLNRNKEDVLWGVSLGNHRRKLRKKSLQRRLAKNEVIRDEDNVQLTEDLVKSNAFLTVGRGYLHDNKHKQDNKYRLYYKYKPNDKISNDLVRLRGETRRMRSGELSCTSWSQCICWFLQANGIPSEIVQWPGHQMAIFYAQDGKGGVGIYSVNVSEAGKKSLRDVEFFVTPFVDDWTHQYCQGKIVQTEATDGRALAEEWKTAQSPCGRAFDFVKTYLGFSPQQNKSLIFGLRNQIINCEFTDGIRSWSVDVLPRRGQIATVPLNLFTHPKHQTAIDIPHATKTPEWVETKEAKKRLLTADIDLGDEWFKKYVRTNKDDPGGGKLEITSLDRENKTIGYRLTDKNGNETTGSAAINGDFYGDEKICGF